MSPRVVLPWPSAALSPNARHGHWASRARAVKQARVDAQMCAREQRFGGVPDDGPILLTLTFCPPDNRRRDLDGLLSRAKAALDGLADALGVDDRRFHPRIGWGEQTRGGALIVEIEQ